MDTCHYTADLKKKKAQHESCELSFIWGKMRTIARETASQIELRNCSKEVGTGFPSGAVVESLPANAGDTGSSPGLGRSHMPRSN